MLIISLNPKLSSELRSRFRLWSKDELFQKVFEFLTSDTDLPDVFLDSTSYKVRQHPFFNKNIDLSMETSTNYNQRKIQGCAIYNNLL